jgi:hypothetical protein
MNACYEHKDNQGAFRIDRTLDESNGLQIECRIIDNLNIENVGYIKMDIEGHEYEALMGLKNILIRDHPTLLIEIHDSTPTRNSTFTILQELGYNNYIKVTHCDYIFLK